MALPRVVDAGDHSEDLGVDKWIISEWILGREIEWEGVDWIHPTQDRDE
jgi:hypothetical protein